jgi:hypothetical protein
MGLNEGKEPKCHGDLQPGQKCASCGANRASLKESHETILRALPADMLDIARRRFPEQTEENIDQIRTMYDIYYQFFLFSNKPDELKLSISRIKQGELPSEVLSDVLSQSSNDILG